MDNDDEVPVLSGMGRGRGRGGVPVLPAGITDESAIKLMMTIASRILQCPLGPTANSGRKKSLVVKRAEYLLMYQSSICIRGLGCAEQY